MSDDTKSEATALQPPDEIRTRIERAFVNIGIVRLWSEDLVLCVRVTCSGEDYDKRTPTTEEDAGRDWRDIADWADSFAVMLASSVERERVVRLEFDLAELDNWFTHHPPIGDQAERYTELRAAGKAFAQKIAELCPRSADRTHAMRVTRDAVFWAISSIACGGR